MKKKSLYSIALCWQWYIIIVFLKHEGAREEFIFRSKWLQMFLLLLIIIQFNVCLLFSSSQFYTLCIIWFIKRPLTVSVNTIYHCFPLKETLMDRIKCEYHSDYEVIWIPHSCLSWSAWHICTAVIFWNDAARWVIFYLLENRS